jgi:DNA/RNA-binding domain of Phe-tRNA-synthetase-like protein
VDCNNLLSLDTGLPISLLDLRALGEQALVRIAAEGESYVFNAAGHDMDLAGLLCVCSAEGSPLGNPVKDSMAGKLKEDSQDYAGFIYAPPSLYTPDALKAVGERFADLLRRYCGAAEAFVAAVV